MILYIINVILCSAIFFGLYKLLFEKEKMYKFNRIYLLVCLVISFIIPFLKISSPISINKTIADNTEKTVVVQNSFSTENVTNKIPPELYTTDIQIPEEVSVTQMSLQLTPYIFISLYLLITLTLIWRFFINLKSIYSLIKKSQVINYGNYNIVLVKQQFIPYSFLNYIFINDTDFKNKNIEDEILYHELTHVKQKHSIDVVIAELISVLFWFNPIFHFYKKAIKLNHEFLADESVINKFDNTAGYQYLLINKARQPSVARVTCQFNFLITKKRLIMMSKNTSPLKALIKKVCVIPVMTIAVLLFCKYAEAKVNDNIGSVIVEYTVLQPQVVATVSQTEQAIPVAQEQTTDKKAEKKVEKQQKKAQKQQDKELKKAEKQREEISEQVKKQHEEAQKQREEAEKQREASLQQAQKQREEAQKQRELMQQQAQKQREESLQQAQKQREQAQKQREQMQQQAQKQREEAQKQRELMQQQAQKQREESLQQAQKQREQAQKQRELMQQQAQKQREEAQKQRELMQQQAQKQRELIAQQNQKQREEMQKQREAYQLEMQTQREEMQRQREAYQQEMQKQREEFQKQKELQREELQKQREELEKQKQEE